jgi:hypothetical protein
MSELAERVPGGRGGWIGALKLAAAGGVALGVLGVLGAHPATEAPWRLLFDVIDWPLDGRPAGFEPATRIMNAIAGGLTIGFSSLLFWLAAGPIARGDRGAAMAGAASVLLWVIPDSLGSLAAGYTANLALNAVFALMFLVPLLALARGR